MGCMDGILDLKYIWDREIVISYFSNTTQSDLNEMGEEEIEYKMKILMEFVKADKKSSVGFS